MPPLLCAQLILLVLLINHPTPTKAFPIDDTISIAVFAGVGAALVLLVIGFVLFVCRRRRRRASMDGEDVEDVFGGNATGWVP